jgi:hypothetical protein
VFGIPFFALLGLVWLPPSPYNLGVLQQTFCSRRFAAGVFGNPKIVMVLITAMEAKQA